SFTSKSTLGRKIYVSCDSGGAVGHKAVAKGAENHIGERSFYGLVIKNCHQFATRCVNYAGGNIDLSLIDRAMASLPDGTFEPTMAALKAAARNKLGATKWRLWDWQNDEDEDEESPPEPDWQSHADHFQSLALDPESI